MVLKNKRVKDIIEFIEIFKVCDITHIQRLFYADNKYSRENAQKKITDMVRDGQIKRKRSNENLRYIYFSGKEPAQLQHRLLITETYVKIKTAFKENDVLFIPEFTKFNGIRPDGFIKITFGRRIYMFFLEVHISNNTLDIDKYERAYIANQSEKIFPEGVFPTIAIVTDKKVEPRSKNLNFIVLDTQIDINRLGIK